MPELFTGFNIAFPHEVRCSFFHYNFTNTFSLIIDINLSAMKLEEECRCLVERCFRIFIRSNDAIGINQFHSCNCNPRLHNQNGRRNCRLCRRKRRYGRCFTLRATMQSDSDLGDDTERTFGTDKQARQIIACCRFFRPASCLQDAAVSQYNG
ncbi:hypothetical protein D9M72_585570 [compost metagenome]